MSRRSSLLVIAAFLLLILPSLTTEGTGIISGKVTCNGKGIEKVAVSNGYDVVLTDSKGRYRLEETNSKGFVFISIPSGFKIKNENGVPRFYYRIVGNEKKNYDFTLEQLEVSDVNHAFFLHADAQILKEKELPLYQNAIDDCLELLADHPLKDNFFGIDCGDLVFDNHSLYDEYTAILGKTGIPFFRVIGNHDRDYNGVSNEKSTQSFETNFGPSYYSFNRGKAHYIVLDDILYLGRDYFYIGYLTGDILTWLENDLSFVPKGSPVFVALHIPTALEEGKKPFEYSKLAERVTNCEALYKLLEPFNAHILAGHTHYSMNLFLAPNLKEHINAAVSGAWWQGKVCVDGTPNGYQVFEVRDDSVSWFYKSIGYSKDYQMRAYPVGSDKDYPDSFIVNVWNWDPSWSVCWYQNGVKMGEMVRYEGIDPEARDLYSVKDKLEHKWISPEKTSHLFMAKPTESNATIEVVATDGFMRKYKTNF